jgi:hypothetical protein
MSIEFGLSQGPFNTKFAPLGAFATRFQQQQTLKPLENVHVALKQVDFSAIDKLMQVLISMLAGCEYISEVNTKLKPETVLAQVWQFERFADQSNLSLTLDQLSLMNLTELEQAVGMIWRQSSRTLHHDWRGFLELDLDLSGLPCGKQAEGSEKGYFSGKKMPLAVSWPELAPYLTAKRSGLTCFPALVPVWLVSSRPWWPSKRC